MRVRTIVAGALVLGAVAASEAGTVTLDQSHGGATPSMTSFGTVEYAQAFTVGRSGTLDHVTIALQKSGSPTDLYMDIRRVTSPASASSAPSNTASDILRTVTVAASGIGTSAPSIVDVSFAAGSISVTTGDILAFTLRYSSNPNPTGGGNAYLIGATNTSMGTSYSGGAAWTRNAAWIQGAPTTWNESPGTDFWFRTYVDVPDGAAVPLPPAALLAIVVLAGGGLVRLQRRPWAGSPN